MRFLPLSAAVLLAAFHLPAQALDFGALANGVASVANAVNGTPANTANTANTVSSTGNSACDAKLREYQDQLALAQAAGKAANNSNVQKLLLQANTLCAQTASTQQPVQAVPAAAPQTAQETAVNAGVKLLGTMLSK
ncbi:MULTISPECIES: hypothetical protein [Pseudomonas]|uniref:hypothetical protein n=1 Tax=Pseudomonas TaxID=286 RepID=UPI00249B64ED|nr:MULTISPECIES: hypothetical protein [Pseudomonas]